MADTEFLTYKEAAEKFGIPVNTLLSWALRRELKRYKRGDGRILVDAAEVTALIARKQRIEPVQ